MKAKSVKRLYGIGQARWYDYFKKLWDKGFSGKSQHDLLNLLKKKLTPSSQVLELGCGTGVNLEKIIALNLPFKSHLALDFSPDMLAIAKKKFKNNPKITFLQQDITKTSKITGKYDIIISTWVLSHLNEPAEVINRTQKLLKKDGKMFLIFLSKPHWFIHIWLYPLARIFFACKYLSSNEINKFKNVTKIQTYGMGVTTLIVIEKN